MNESAICVIFVCRCHVIDFVICCVNLFDLTLILIYFWIVEIYFWSGYVISLVEDCEIVADFWNATVRHLLLDPNLLEQRI